MIKLLKKQQQSVSVHKQTSIEWPKKKTKNATKQKQMPKRMRKCQKNAEISAKKRGQQIRCKNEWDKRKQKTYTAE